jgi:hypothetical protein
LLACARCVPLQLGGEVEDGGCWVADREMRREPPVRRSFGRRRRRGTGRGGMR